MHDGRTGALSKACFSKKYRFAKGKKGEMCNPGLRLLSTSLKEADSSSPASPQLSPEAAARSSGERIARKTATVALSPEPLQIGRMAEGMPQLHTHLWRTHPDASPFVPLNAFMQAASGLAARQAAADSSVRQPDSMQVDSNAAPGGANASSSAADLSAAAAACRAAHSGAGPSGVAPGGSDDATMAEPPARKAARKHSDAPMRKLSANLIDTYKLINQVCCARSPFFAAGVWWRPVRATGAGEGAAASWAHGPSTPRPPRR